MEFAGETENILRFWVGSLIAFCFSCIWHMLYETKFVWEEALIILQQYMQLQEPAHQLKQRFNHHISAILTIQFLTFFE